MAGIGLAKKGLGLLGKALKKKPKPSKANNWEGESKFDWIDRKDAEDAIAAGEKPPKIKIGKIAKNIVRGAKVGVAAMPASYAYGKWKKHLRDKKKRTKKSIGGVAKIVGKKAMNYIKKNRKKIGKEISSPEGKKKIQDLTSKFKRGFRKD